MMTAQARRLRMGQVLAATLGSGQRLATLLALALLAGCGGGRDAFLEGRVQDTCNGAWPICAKIAGCLLGAQSYATGRLPGAGQFVVQLAEPSTVQVHFFLEQVGASGDETVVTFHESGCSSRSR